MCFYYLISHTNILCVLTLECMEVALFTFHSFGRCFFFSPSNVHLFTHAGKYLGFSVFLKDITTMCTEGAADWKASFKINRELTLQLHLPPSLIDLWSKCLGVNGKKIHRQTQKQHNHTKITPLLSSHLLTCIYTFLLCITMRTQSESDEALGNLLLLSNWSEN